jgi:hypothetical protein
MRYFRRLPPLLRVVSILALLFDLTALVVFLAGLPIIQAAFPWLSLDAHRAMGIGLNLLSLSLACSLVVNSYIVRFRRVGWASYPLASWQSQMRWLVLLGALPLGVLLVVLLLPRSPLVAFVLGLPTLLGLLVQGAALFYGLAKWPALT